MRTSATTVAVVSAGVLLALALWARGLPSFVAWEVATDHERCFGRRQLPARVFSDDPSVVRRWLEARGTPIATLPGREDGLEIAGARFCPLHDRLAAHVYFVGDDAPVSVFVLSGPARIGDGWTGESRGLHVRLLRSAGRVVAVVGEHASVVEALARQFRTSVVLLSPVGPAPRLTVARRGC
jgi:hypothetical protein